MSSTAGQGRYSCCAILSRDDRIVAIPHIHGFAPKRAPSPDRRATPGRDGVMLSRPVNSGCCPQPMREAGGNPVLTRNRDAARALADEPGYLRGLRKPHVVDCVARLHVALTRPCEQRAARVPPSPQPPAPHSDAGRRRHRSRRSAGTAECRASRRRHVASRRLQCKNRSNHCDRLDRSAGPIRPVQEHRPLHPAGRGRHGLPSRPG